MISSLANFLMLIVYQGGQPGRVSWTLLMFTMGAVGIARVAIEKDRMYSLGYAGVLGIATFVTLMRFVSSPIFVGLILALIAYLADRIVRDCTLINEDVDSSDQGLLDSGRLFARKDADSTDADDESQPNEVDRRTAETKKRASQPGRTVLYLAMAALPLFGLGQFFLRSDPTTWSQAQKLLAFYLFASLSLLVTTSFLGLRRYLRQRKVEMPSDVSVAWIGGGLVLIGLILAIAFLAPVPGKLLASFELPSYLDSPGDTIASKLGWGDDGADQKTDSAATTGNDASRTEKETDGIKQGKDAPAGDVGDGEKKSGPPGKQSGNDKGSPSDAKSEESSGPKQEPSESKSPESKSSDSKPPPDDKKQQSESESQPETTSPPQDSNPPESTQEQSPKENPKNSDSKSGDSGATSGNTPKQSPTPPLTDSLPGLSSLLKMIAFLVLAGIVAAFAYLHRDAIALWWRSLFQVDAPERDASRDDLSMRQETQSSVRPFSSFQNPIGREADPRRIIVVTFDAWEAWCRERGMTRHTDETPSEFLRRTHGGGDLQTKAATRIVAAYNAIAYGRGNATDADVAAASSLWDAMSTSPRPTLAQS